MEQFIKRNRLRRQALINARNREEKEVSLMYPSEKKDMMLVFDESHRMLGTAAPKDIINNAREIDYDHNKAIIQRAS